MEKKDRQAKKETKPGRRKGKKDKGKRTEGRKNVKGGKKKKQTTGINFTTENITVEVGRKLKLK